MKAFKNPVFKEEDEILLCVVADRAGLVAPRGEARGQVGVF